MTDAKASESKRDSVNLHPSTTDASFTTEAHSKLMEVYDLFEEGHAEFERASRESLEGKRLQTALDARITKCETIESILSDVYSLCNDEAQKECVIGLFLKVATARTVLAHNPPEIM